MRHGRAVSGALGKRARGGAHLEAHEHGAEDLLLVATHLRRHAAQQRRPQEVAARVLGHLDAAAVQQQLRALVDALVGGGQA
jgi:hypothetical protein